MTFSLPGCGCGAASVPGIVLPSSARRYANSALQAVKTRVDRTELKGRCEPVFTSPSRVMPFLYFLPSLLSRRWFSDVYGEISGQFLSFTLLSWRVMERGYDAWGKEKYPRERKKYHGDKKFFHGGKFVIVLVRDWIAFRLGGKLAEWEGGRWMSCWSRR